MASKKELQALITLAGRIDPSLQTAMMKAAGHSQKLANETAAASRNMNKVATIAKGAFLGTLAAKAFTTATNKVRELWQEGQQLASDLQEVQNVVDTTFRESSGSINDWSKQALQNFGLTELSAKQFSSTLGSLFKNAGVANKDMTAMSQNLAGLAGDYASFYNIGQDEAFDKIRSAMSGQTDGLKQLGINMSVANLQAFALSKGIKTSYSNMNQATQAMLRYSYLMSVSSDVQGDYIKTAGSLANQQRLFKANTQQMAASIAQKALPALTKLYQTVNEFMMNADVTKAAAMVAWGFETLGDAIQWAQRNSSWLIPVMAGVATGLAAYLMVSKINGLMKLWNESTIKAILIQDGLKVAMATNPIMWIPLAIGAAVAAGVILWRNWDKITAKAKELWAAVNRLLEPLKKFFGFGKKTLEIETRVSSSGEINALNKSLPGYALGGFANQPSIFGEGPYPEVAIPLRKTPRSLGLLDQTSRILGVGGGKSISLTYAPTIYGGNREEVESLLSKHKDELLLMLEELLREKERVAYA